MLICLWKGCEFASEQLAAFQEHLITKHALQQQQPQQQQLNLDKQNDVGTEGEEEMVEEEQMAKMIQLHLDEDKMIKRGGMRKIIFLAVEVWVDVLGFIKRIQLARSVCLINLKIYDICWPRLHGNKVVAHKVGPLIISYRHDLGHPPTALLLKEIRGVPFPECPPPAYITGFGRIRIHFLDHQVFTFLSRIAPRITTNQVGINFAIKMSHMDKNELASVNQLLQLFRKEMPTMSSITFWRCLSNIPFLPADVDNNMKIIYSLGIEESDIPILMHFLSSPRPDGQQRVMCIEFLDGQLAVAQKLVDAIKEVWKFGTGPFVADPREKAFGTLGEFRKSTQPVPQPFYICCMSRRHNLDIPQSEEQNPQTDETLTIRSRPGFRGSEICRHPRGQHEQWADDAGKRFIEWHRNNSTTYIDVDILEFGVPFFMDSI